jgi:hypothetical protein
MSRKADAHALLDREFHLIRAQVLSLAASLDRLDRASSSSPEAEADERLRLIRDSIAILPAPGPDRAERVQLHFSDPYADDWRSRLGVPTL